MVYLLKRNKSPLDSILSGSTWFEIATDDELLSDYFIFQSFTLYLGRVSGVTMHVIYLGNQI